MASADEVEANFRSRGDVEWTGSESIRTGDGEGSGLHLGGAGVGVSSRKNPSVGSSLGDASNALCGGDASDAIADSACDLAAAGHEADVGVGGASESKGLAVIHASGAGDGEISGEFQLPTDSAGGGKACGCAGLVEGHAAGGAVHADDAVSGFTGAVVNQGRGVAGRTDGNRSVGRIDRSTQVAGSRAAADAVEGGELQGAFGVSHRTGKAAGAAEDQWSVGGAQFDEAARTADRAAKGHVSSGGKAEGVGGSKSDRAVEVGGETIAIAHGAAIEDEGIGEVVVAVEREDTTGCEGDGAGSKQGVRRAAESESAGADGGAAAVAVGTGKRHVAGAGFGQAARAGNVAGERDGAVAGAAEGEIGIEDQRRADANGTGTVLIDLREGRTVGAEGEAVA